jgi:vitamin B12 transporter
MGKFYTFLPILLFLVTFKMNKKNVRAMALWLFMTHAMWSQNSNTEIKQLDEVVVSDSKFALSKEKSGRVILKITAEELAKRQGQSLSTVLNSVAGLQINGSGGAGGRNQSYYMRGARNQQTMILIDGVPVSDASGISLDYDLRLIPIEQVASIEIMKGAASTLYGSGASAGVINITLKRAEKNQFSGNVYVNSGTQVDATTTNYKPQEHNQGFGFGTKTEKFHFYTSVNSSITDGISDAKGAGFETDPFSRFNSMVNMGFNPSKKVSFDISYRYNDMQTEFDSGSYNDNTENSSNSKQYSLSFSPKYVFQKGEMVLNLSSNQIDRTIFQFDSYSYFKSRNFTADVFVKKEISNQLFVVLGTQFQFYEMSNKSDYAYLSEKEAKFNIVDPYMNLVYTSNFGLNLNAGGRLNLHSNYGNHWVYNINPSFHFKNSPVKLLATYSTAFVSPSLYQLFAEYYGNENLMPEDSKTIEAGIEIGLLKNKLKVNAVAFSREDKNAIGFDLINEVYFNQNQTNITKGIETNIAYQISNQWRLTCNYAYNELEVAARILNPKHKLNTTIDFAPNNRLDMQLMCQMVSKRYYEYNTYPEPDYIPTLNSLYLNAYQLFDINLRYYFLNKKLSTFVLASNVLNTDYEELYGYSTKGRNFKLGLNYSF